MPDLFNLKTVSMHEPLIDDPFYAWLNENVDRGNPGDSLLIRYLKSQGFIVGEHRITEEQAQILCYVEEAWFRCTPYHTPMSLDEMFVPGDAYCVSGLDHRCNITPELISAVANAGWIYPVEPNTTYFEINDGRVYAKYQQILGSRFICRVREG